MCGRFILGDFTWAEYFDALRIIRPEDHAASWNIKPTQSVLTFRRFEGGLAASFARWWFVPHWHKGDVKDWKQTTFNARIESAHEKPTFRTAWRQNRCLIPASGYYEWTGPKGKRRPNLIHLEINEPFFFFAGLRSVMADGSETCTILTREALPEIAGLHHRMPVILSSAQVDPWLDQTAEDAEVIAEFGNAWEGKFLTREVKSFGRDDDGPHLIDDADPFL